MQSDSSDIRAWIPAIIIAGIVIATGIILQKLANAYFHRLARKDRWPGGLVFVSSLRGMIVLVSAVAGIYEALVHSPLQFSELQNIKKLHNAIIILIITIVLGRVLRGLLKAYTHNEEGIRRSLSLFNTIIGIVVYCVGGLIILDNLGISITPIITALGVGGLAVALALQDTLSNLFAGIHITVAHILKPGDYIALSSGEEGTVSDITWRCTTLLTQSGNIVVIPNSKLAATIVTNYSLPEKSLDVSIPITFSFGTDLDKAEKITLDASEKVMREMGFEQSKPVFRVKEIGEYGIRCGLIISVREFSQQYLVRHNIIKGLHKSFPKEGIILPYPTREYRKANDD